MIREEEKLSRDERRQRKFNNIFNIMSIYIKYLLGDEVNEDEHKQFLEYSKFNIYKIQGDQSEHYKMPEQDYIRMVMNDPSQYLTEKDYCMGDVVLQFPNPDEMAYATISYIEAQEFLQQGIGTRCSIEFKTEQLDYEILSMAFQYAYSQLADSKQDDLGPNKLAYSNQFSTQNLIAAIKLFFKEDDQLNIQGEYNEFVEMVRNKVMNSLNKNFKVSKNREKRKGFSTILKKKILTRGKFIIKTAGGLQRTHHKVKDFHTLIRNLILLRLSQKGFKMRTFVSSDNKSIFAVLYCAEANISLVAQQIKMRKFLNLEFTDLLSLEPIDQNYRPLRLNNRLWRNDLDVNQSSYFQYIKPKIINLLKKINFKKMAKELHIQNLNDQMFDYGQRDLIGDEEGPSDELWEAYYEYLVYLEQRVTEAREKFYFKLDFAVLMNPSIAKKKEKKAETKIVTKAQLRRVTKKNDKSNIDINQLIDLNDQDRTIKQEQQIKRYFSYQRKKFIPKTTKKNQNIKQYNENPLIICDTYSKDFNSILLKILQHLVRDKLNLDINEKETNIEAYLKQIQHYFDDEEDAETNLKKLVDPNGDSAQKKIIDQLCIQMKEIPEKVGQKQFTLTRDKNPVYYDSMKQQLIECLFLTFMEKEEEVWKDQIQDEQQQFLNMKKVFHLKWNQICTKFLKERQRGLLAQAYGTAMRDGMQIINNAKGNLLKCIWDFSFGELYNIAISSEYTVSGRRFSYKKKSRINTIWKKYQVSESGRISVFSIMERIKLANYLVNQAINIPYIFNKSYLEQIFGLNDQYELNGLSNKRFFQSDPKAFSQTLSSDAQEYIRLLQEKFLIAESLFVKPKLHNLEEIWKMKIGEIWHVPSDEVREYYGEKIALYFTFLGHYTKSLLIPGIIGLICTIIQSLTEPRVSIVIAMMFGILHSSFLTLMLGSWKLKEKQIVAQFAQNIKQGNEQQEQRPAFQGEYRRDPCNDEANTLYYPMSKLLIHMLKNGLILGFVFSIYIGSVIGLFYMTKFFYEYDIFTSLERLNFLKLEVSIPCSINVLILNIFEYIYERLAESMTDQENHQTVADFEANFIIKKFTLMLLSYFAPIFMIAFLNQELGIDCAYGDCNLNAKYFFSSLFIILFVFNIKEVVTPVINKLFNRTQEQPETIDEYGIINYYVEQESQKDSYFKSVDRYGTVDDYMEIIIQSGLLGLFAPLFPASMFIGFVWNALEMQTDKIKLIKYSQRPVPLDEQSIGIWSLLLEFLANFSIIFNTGVVFLMGKLHPDRNGPTPPLIKDVTMFLIIILIAFALRFILEGLIPEATYEFISIMKRQTYLLKSTIEHFKKKTSKMKRLKSDRNTLSRYVLFKPYGTILKVEKKQKQLNQEEDDDDDDDESQIEIEQKQKEEDSQREAMPEILLVKRRQIILRKNIHNFDFPYKKFEIAHAQKEFDDKIARLKKLLRFFEKYYTLKWCEQRLLYRRLYQRRRYILYKYLNIRKLKVFIESYRQLFNRYKRLQEEKREAGLMEDNNDREQKTARINQVAKKKALQQVKNVAILKSKGVWFGQFRRQVPILRAKDMIEHLKRLDQKLSKLKLNQRLIPIQMIKINKDKLIKDRPRIFEEISCLDISKSSSQEILKLLIQSRDQYVQVNQYKSELVRSIEDLYSLKTRKIESIQSQLYHQEVPNYLYLDQEELKSLFIQNQKAQMRTLDFKMIKMIEKDKQKEVWLILQQYQLKILEVIEIDLQHKNVLFEDLILQEFTLFDHFYFPQSKGVVGKILDSRYELLNGWTLFDTIKFRQSVNMTYKKKELLLFLLNLLNSIPHWKDKKVITPKSIYANRNKNQIGYTFHWMMCGNRDIEKEKLYLPNEENNNNLSKMVYNAAMIVVYMMTLGQIETNKDYLIEHQARLMNKYPIVFTIISDMLLSENQRKPYNYFKQLCKTECENEELFLENERLSQQLIEDSKILDINYQDLKLYDQNELSNQLETQKLHQVLSQQLFKMDMLYKFKLFKQFQEELNVTDAIASSIYNKEFYMIHISKNFAFYCDKAHHQKLMLDFIQFEFYKQLHYFFNNLTLQGIYSISYQPNLSDIYHFITKVERYSSPSILDDFDQQSDKLLIRKRLRVQKENYEALHKKLEQIRLKFLFLQAYGEMFKQNSSYAIELFNKALKFCNNPLRQLILHINIGRIQKDRLQSIQYLSKLDCQSEYYSLKIRNLLIKLHLESEQYHEAMKKCVIIKPSDEQCLFEQLVHQETLILQSQTQWCLDHYQNNYDYLNYWIQKYKSTQSKHNELALIGLYNLECCINLLYYNYNIHFVEDYLQLLYQYSDKNLFLIDYLQFKLLQIINLQLGMINYGMITQYDKNSEEGQQRLLLKSYQHMPKSFSRQNDYLSQLFFELECNLQMDMDYELYLEINEQQLRNRYHFLIAKQLFTKQKYSQAKSVLDNTKCNIDRLIDAWQMKNNKMIELQHDVKFQLNDLSWKNLFITFVFDLNNLYAQLVCKLAFKLIEIASQKHDCKQLQQQFKIFFVKLLLEEYKDKENNEYIDKNFEIKFFILTTLNQYLQDLSLNLLSEICDIEDKIKQKELIDYKDISIPVDKRQMEKKSICLNDLFVVQSQLLEESGDPIAALKCLDVQYALILYDERFSRQVQQVFSQKMENDDPNLLGAKCKVAIMKLFLNIFSCGPQLLKTRKAALLACVDIVTSTAEQAKLRMNEFPTTKIIWDDHALNILDYAKPKQLEAFQKYKLIYYQCEWKLLEYYALVGMYKEAHNHFQMLYNHYVKLNSQEDYARTYFEYSIGTYFLFIRQTHRASLFFERAARRYLDQQIFYEDLKLPLQNVSGSFRDKFTNDSLLLDLLNQFNHYFTLRSRCRIYKYYSRMYEKDTDLHRLFQSIIRILEKIRKTMGRKSILYVDALMIYAEFILIHKERGYNGFQTFKMAFKSHYFFTRREAEFFEPYVYKSHLPYKFYTPDDIEERLSETLITQWIFDLLDQCYRFYKEYFNSVNVTEHFSVVYCDILQYRIAFIANRLYQAQIMLDRALSNLEKLCPTCEHPYGVMIYEGYALLCENLERVQEDNIKIILECPSHSLFNTLTYDQRYKITVQIYLRNEQLGKYFDDYKNNGFEVYLLQKLQKFTEKKQQERISMKQQKLTKKQTILLDFDTQMQIKQGAKREALMNQDKITDVKLKVGNTGYYRKAYRICKVIFKEYNELYRRVEDKFIELSRQEERENKID
ncbi:unnamed protein product [Paramecium octaurelia]|uniref:Anoctamin transmembrane domain-containing protein n=1 Tax=Paramecium octaurelia TaxID=43137 RepID=A0A8S1YAB4_PAROT|nr:unnamed protein product [Paramecium octaurelia]